MLGQKHNAREMHVMVVIDGGIGKEDAALSGAKCDQNKLLKTPGQCAKFER